MNIFKPFNFQSIFSNLGSGSGGDVPYTILYNMSRVAQLADGTRYLPNLGSGTSAYNAPANASNFIDLTNTGATVDLPIVHTLAADSKKLATSVDAGWTDNLNNTYTGATVTGDIVGVSTDTSGTVKVTIAITGWTAGDVNGYGADGTYTFEETLTASLNLTGTGFTGTVEVVSVEAITVPTASYINYRDMGTDTQVQIQANTLPVSTTHTMTTSFQAYWGSTKPTDQADRLAMEADPNLIFRVWFNGESLPSGIVKADIVNFVPANEGIASGEWLQDLGVDLGAEVSGYGTLLQAEAGSTIVEHTPTTFTINGTATGATSYKPRILFNFSQAPVSLYLVETRARITEGTCLIQVGINGVQSLLSAGLYVDIAYSTVGRSDITVNGTNASNIYPYNVECEFIVKELTAYQIQSYTSAVRDDNGTKGATNLLLTQDASGRATGIATANTTQWKDDGRTAPTGWTVTAPYTITETIGADTYTFTSDLNRYKNSIADGTFIAPTGVWTLDAFGFDGVTPVAQRGLTKMIEAVVIP